MGYRSLMCVGILGLAGCSSDPVAPEELQEGVLATFLVVDETFKLWVTNETTIQQILELEAGSSLATIPNGPLVAGSGRAAYNAPYSWHLDPDLTEMAELTIEVCSGKPSFVEEDLDTWINVVGHFCPWSAELLSVEDLR